MRRSLAPICIQGRVRGRRRVLRLGLLGSLVLALGLALGVAAPVAHAEPPTTHEILSNRPSGFWTSNRPAVGGAYRWRLLGIGVVIASATGYGMWRLVKRANAERAAQKTAK
ncbi:MAG TPA: hypothetical protein VFT22_27190 [Kofleriaceae bacterium]|nr:hypothetical protein [Kofleriaceae bacterium]